MKYRISGVRRDTGEDASIIIEAVDEKAAIKNSGLMVECVEPIRERDPLEEFAAKTPAASLHKLDYKSLNRPSASLPMPRRTPSFEILSSALGVLGALGTVIGIGLIILSFDASNPAEALSMRVLGASSLAGGLVWAAMSAVIRLLAGILNEVANRPAV